MKRMILTILLCGVMVLGITGCGKSTTEVSTDELNDVNNQIIEYFSSSNVEYDNLSFNYVDLTNKKVIVGLQDNSKEQQDKFRKLVIDSELIEFIKGDKLMDADDYNNQ